MMILNLKETNIVFDGDPISNNEIKIFSPFLTTFRNTGILKERLSFMHHCRNKIFRSCKLLNDDFVYMDTFLWRFWKKRLKRFKERKSQYSDRFMRLKNEKLFLSQFVRDCVDYRNQLFW